MARQSENSVQTEIGCGRADNSEAESNSGASTDGGESRSGSETNGREDSRNSESYSGANETSIEPRGGLGQVLHKFFARYTKHSEWGPTSSGLSNLGDPIPTNGAPKERDWSNDLWATSLYHTDPFKFLDRMVTAIRISWKAFLIKEVVIALSQLLNANGALTAIITIASL